MSEEQRRAEPEKKSSRAPQRKAARKLYEWVEWVAGVAIAVVLILSLGVRVVGVYGESMLPTLVEGDRLLATRLTGAPKQFDIVAITQPNSINKPLIKRVIAVGGQTIDIDFRTGDVTVDGEVLDEPYIRERITRAGRGDVKFPLTVPEGFVFAMGDNRNESLDSRFSEVGLIDERYILGSVFFRFAPFGEMGTL